MTTTQSDNELFELCKEVYKRTGWEDTKTHWIRSSGILSRNHPVPANECPEYTSDYLLEKLPRFIQPGNVPYWLTVSTVPTIDGAAYVDGFDRRLHTCRSETPLKAILKLVIALDDAKELV